MKVAELTGVLVAQWFYRTGVTEVVGSSPTFNSEIFLILLLPVVKQLLPFSLFGHDYVQISLNYGMDFP